MKTQSLSLSVRPISTLWHILSFFTTYAEIDRYDVTWQLADEHRNVIDRWLLSRLNGLVSDVVEYLDRYDYYLATLAIDSFIGELSNWFVRTSRRRFWKNEKDLDKISAYVSLFETLWTLSTLIAPFVPFISEYITKPSLDMLQRQERVFTSKRSCPATRSSTSRG